MEVDLRQLARVKRGAPSLDTSPWMNAADCATEAKTDEPSVSSARGRTAAEKSGEVFVYDISRCVSGGSPEVSSTPIR